MCCPHVVRFVCGSVSDHVIKCDEAGACEMCVIKCFYLRGVCSKSCSEV